MNRSYFATCGRGIEPVLADELRALGAADVEPGRGGVRFAGDRALLYQTNLWLRTAVRVLQPILEADVASPDDLYDAVFSLDWSQYLTPGHTLAVDCNVRDSRITHGAHCCHGSVRRAADDDDPLEGGVLLSGERLMQAGNLARCISAGGDDGDSAAHGLSPRFSACIYLRSHATRTNAIRTDSPRLPSRPRATMSIGRGQ